MHPVSHRDEVQRVGTWRTTAAARRRRDLSERPTSWGGITAVLAAAQSGRQIFTWSSLSAAHGARIATSNQPPATGHRRRAGGVNLDLLQFRTHCTMGNGVQSV
jgi:hypothetical protein